MGGYPNHHHLNAAMSGDALRDWAEVSVQFSSRWADSPERILAERVARWGKAK